MLYFSYAFLVKRINAEKLSATKTSVVVTV